MRIESCAYSSCADTQSYKPTCIVRAPIIVARRRCTPVHPSFFLNNNNKKELIGFGHAVLVLFAVCCILIQNLASPALRVCEDRGSCKASSHASFIINVLLSRCYIWNKYWFCVFPQKNNCVYSGNKERGAKKEWKLNNDEITTFNRRPLRNTHWINDARN